MVKLLGRSKCNVASGNLMTTVSTIFVGTTLLMIAINANSNTNFHHHHAVTAFQQGFPSTTTIPTRPSSPLPSSKSVTYFTQIATRPGYQSISSSNSDFLPSSWSSPTPHRPPLRTTVQTQLFASKKDQRQQQQHSQSPDASGDIDRVNYGMILTNIANQVLIGSTIWIGGQGYQVLTSNANFDVGAVILAIVGFLPLYGLSSFIESSEWYGVSGLNLSTNMAVLRMFGSTPKPIQAVVLSAAMAVLTGIVEETTFRGQSLTFFANNVGDGSILTGAVLSTLLFAFLHTNPTSFFKGGDETADNIVLFTFQCLTGTIFCLLYLLTGNLAVPIITHALYDFYTFVKVHFVDVAGQMEYAKEQSIMPKYNNIAAAKKWSNERGADFIKGVQQSFYLMDTNRDGVLSRKELRVALFSYGINLSQVQSQEVLQRADTDRQGDIDLDEFLAFVGPTGSARKAVRNTLFGPL